MYQDKTLVVFFCMHRSGSSFATSVFQRLGMSLGPFELLGANESNPYGHFEAAPILALAQKLQSSGLGFDGDFPRDRAGLQRFVESGGKWPADSEFLARQRHRGRRLIEQLVASGPVSGFKDPRTVLTWPYWESVLKDFPGLRVAGLFLLRSPHEIAMSMFQRSRGDCSYEDALDVTAVHLRRMKHIFDQWQGNRAVLQFEPRAFARQAPAAAAMCGLEWNPASLADLYDPQCRHHSPVRIAHEAQKLYEALAAAEGNSPASPSQPARLCREDAPGAYLGSAAAAPIEGENLRQLLADAASREDTLRGRCAMLIEENEKMRRLFQRHLGVWHPKLQRLEAKVRALEVDKATWAAYQRSPGWAVWQAERSLRKLLVPDDSRRKAALKFSFRAVGSLLRSARRAVARFRFGRFFRHSKPGDWASS